MCVHGSIVSLDRAQDQSFQGSKFELMQPQDLGSSV